MRPITHRSFGVLLRFVKWKWLPLIPAGTPLPARRQVTRGDFATTIPIGRSSYFRVYIEQRNGRAGRLVHLATIQVPQTGRRCTVKFCLSRSGILRVSAAAGSETVQGRLVVDTNPPKRHRRGALKFGALRPLFGTPPFPSLSHTPLRR